MGPPGDRDISARVTQRDPGSWAVRKHGFSLQTVKDSRQREFDAGRPSSLEDFSREHGICSACRGNGNLIVGARWTDESGSEQVAFLREDEGPASISDLRKMHGLDLALWHYLYETCAACHGTGKLPVETCH